MTPCSQPGRYGLVKKAEVRNSAGNVRMSPDAGLPAALLRIAYGQDQSPAAHLVLELGGRAYPDQAALIDDGYPVTGAVGYCLSSLGAATDLPSQPAVHRLVTVTLDALRHR